MYFGHCIRIEPYEWGYLAEITAPTSGRHILAASSSAMDVLEQAFDYVDSSIGELGAPKD